ncbi:MAG: TatD family hydrolase [Elusimicrobia bacterium]|nr:TatD family hydrolase [Elusimicrobiota bacterium]
MFIETHAHLNDKAFDADRDAVLDKCRAAGVDKLVEIACAAGEWGAGEKLAAARQGAVFCAFGLHPENIEDAGPRQLAELPAWLEKKCCVALGEIGLDYWWKPEKKTEQLRLLAELLPLSVKFSKPVVFHTRNGRDLKTGNAYFELAQELKDWTFNNKKKARGVLHCFSGGWEDAKAALDLGLLLGINGTFTYKNNGPLREIVKKAGLENIVLETDCPYLSVQSMRGKRNDPSYIPEIARAAAEYLNIKVEALAVATTANAVELFFRNCKNLP